GSPRTWRVSARSRTAVAMAPSSCPGLRGGERRNNETESENDREPDPPHGHLGGGRLPGSLAERREAHQRPGMEEHRGAGYSAGDAAGDLTVKARRPARATAQEIERVICGL